MTLEARQQRLALDAWADGRRQETLIVVFHSFDGEVPFAAPMKRDPTPSLGPLGEGGLAAAYAAALSENPAIHDGAVLIRVPDPTTKGWEITAWSARLFAPDCGGPRRANSGSALESALDMSAVPGIEAVFCLKADGAHELRGGLEVGRHRERAALQGVPR